MFKNGLSTHTYSQLQFIPSAMGNKSSYSLAFSFSNFLYLMWGEGERKKGEGASWEGNLRYFVNVKEP